MARDDAPDSEDLQPGDQHGDEDDLEQPPRRPGLLARGLAAVTAPLRRLWTSDDTLDDYTLVHMTSVAGDAFMAIALADTVFFSVPTNEAKVRVALYLALTMAPLAVAGFVLVPLLDRAGPRRTISAGAAAARVLLALVLAPRLGALALYPLAFAMLVMSKIHVITKNGLTIAYADERHTSLVKANARLGIWAVVGAALAVVPGIALAKGAGTESVVYAAAAVYGLSAMLNLRLPHPRLPKKETIVAKRGRIPELTIAAAGAGALRAAQGFLIFLLAFALRRSEEPPWWGAVIAGAALVGGFIGDLAAPRLPRWVREEAVVLGSLFGAAIGAVLAFEFYGLTILAVYAFVAGLTTELGRLAFQSRMQGAVPENAQGRVFVRYEVLFQLAWVGGAFIPAILPITFRQGVLVMAGFYLFVGLTYMLRPMINRARAMRPKSFFDQERPHR